MKINTVFTIAAVIMIVLGLAQLLAPVAMATGAGMGDSLSPAFIMTIRFAGAEFFGLGLIAWLVRNAEASKTRDAVTLGFTIYFALHALTSLYGQLTSISSPAGWVAVVIQGLLAVGFFMAGRASMSTSLANSTS
jgi:hypothetical protein